MRTLSFLLGGIFLIVSESGCGVARDGGAGQAGAVVIPTPEEVSQIHVRIEDGPAIEKQFPGAPFELVVKDKVETKALLDWLKGVDWSKQGADTAVMDVFLVGEIEATRWDGSGLSFSLTPQGIIYANRLRDSDTDRLAKIINRLHKEG